MKRFLPIIIIILFFSAIGLGAWFLFDGELYSLSLRAQRSNPNEIAARPSDARNDGEDAFTYTDDNTGEDIIIKSDKADYTTVGQAEVYLSLSGMKEDETTFVQFLFPDDGSEIQKVEIKNGDRWEDLAVKTDSLNYEHKKKVPEDLKSLGYISFSPTRYKLQATSYLRLTISYPVDVQGEFWVEAFGDKGSYGLLK